MGRRGSVVFSGTAKCRFVISIGRWNFSNWYGPTAVGEKIRATVMGVPETWWYEDTIYNTYFIENTIKRVIIFRSSFSA